MSIDIAIRRLDGRIEALLKAQPLTPDWFELQALGRAISFLRMVKGSGLDTDPRAIQDCRATLKAGRVDEVEGKPIPKKSLGGDG